MFSTSDLTLKHEMISGNQDRSDAAHTLFDRVRFNAIVRKVGEVLGMNNQMPVLSQYLSGRVVRGQRESRTQNVEVTRIIGSESRARDFDRMFNPVSDRARHRWVGIASLRMREAPLPPVELIQIGKDYFVRDGHHRVSVARTLGAAFIDARVIELDVE